MEEFVIGVVSSLVASMIAIMGGIALSPRMRSWPTLLLSRFTGLGICRIYQRQRVATEDLAAELSKARWVRVLTGRGNELTRGGFAALWEDEGRRLDFVQVLLPDTEHHPASWLEWREDEIRRIDPGFSCGMLAEQVEINASYINQVAADRGNIEMRRYNLPNLHRVVITDRVAFLTLYRRAAHGRDSPCILAPRPGLMYDYALNLFTTAWSHV
ncbi:hypothetical protein Skr01_23900 [Sphaerisporangium krabiense]|uniref:Uncharacterized protein n=1 Tax=Sphaerisporangium krabiense TaxID=763782 RepID=A0A7W8Z667_9ACTN|nr:hypothetical protein [Sphaerisporangium krabiense]MBB5628136.1 hypothetical protein [Sphaerisporangium krabiense]GII62305.1 hypothetical protein Skr01_23900 [Sphaerisporangium krabiense]